MSRRAITLGGTAAVAGIGYYLYQAGGDPKVAKIEAKHDAEKLQAKVKGGSEDLRGEAERLSGEAGKKLDAGVAEARAKTRQFDSTVSAKAGEAQDKAAQFKKDASADIASARKDAAKKIDEIDGKVEKKASEAKSGISSWLGFK